MVDFVNVLVLVPEAIWAVNKHKILVLVVGHL
jgi:hypothetical protein